MPEHVVAIVNPASSSGRTSRRLPDIERRLRGEFPALRVFQSEARGHATLLCRQALESGADLILSVGGDGTNNEVLCGFMDGSGDNRFPEAELGLVASGTGSDFQRYLDRAWEGPPGQARAIDYGLVHFVDHEGHPCTRPFLNEASAGITGLVGYQVGRSNKILGPAATYLVGSVRAIASFQPRPVRITMNEERPREIDLTMAVFANGQYFGGGMWVAPTASCEDGRLETVVAGRFSRGRMLRLLAELFRGRHVGRPGVETGRATRATLDPVRPSDVILLDVDGEQPGRLPARVELRAGGLRLRPSVHL